MARPDADAAVVLAGVAAIAWLELAGWVSVAELDRRLALTFPDVPGTERRELLDRGIRMLAAEGLLDRRDR